MKWYKLIKSSDIRLCVAIKVLYSKEKAVCQNESIFKRTQSNKQE